jgi:hypothetical protein
MDERVVMVDGGEILQITQDVARCFTDNFPNLKAYLVNDIKGEDHVYAIDENGKPMFDMLVSSSMKFVFLWYYIHPKKGMKMVSEMKDISLASGNDFVVKYPNVPVKKEGWPSIVRYGKKPAGLALEKFIVKAGNPQLEETTYSEENLNTYRSYVWDQVPNALDLILNKAKEMTEKRLPRRKGLDMTHVRGYFLYAGCAYHMAYPHLGFGMRDIDVEVILSPKQFSNTRCAQTEPCGIKEFGEPEYFKGHTRWLDLMWNSMHTETGDINHDLLVYLNEMRHRSDRWATISQRPIINLETKQTVYTPNWLKKLESIIHL